MDRYGPPVARARRVDRADLYQRPEYLDLQARLADRVRRLRARRGWSQTEAATRCGMTKQHYQRVEAAGMNVSFVTLARLVAGFSVDASKLIAPKRVPAALRDPERKGRTDRVK